MIETPRYKVHISYVWMGSISAAISMLIAVVALAFGVGIAILEETGVSVSGVHFALIFGLALVVFLVVTGLVALFQYYSYKHLWYELGVNEFSLYSGVFSKKRVHVPYQRVQSVNQRASLLQRIIGVCTVHIDTAGGAANKAVTVPYLRKSDAEWLRTTLFSQKQAIMQAHAAAKAQAGGGVAVGAASAMGAAGAFAGAPGMQPAMPPVPTGQPAMPAPPSGQPALSAEAMPPSPVYSAPVGQPLITGAPHPPTYSAPQGTSRTGNILDAPAESFADAYGILGGDSFDLGTVS
jgi:putative membrane protein